MTDEMKRIPTPAEVNNAERQSGCDERIAVFPRMPAKQSSPGKCVMCGAKGDTPVTPIRFGDFWKGVVVPMCDRCLNFAADTLAAACDKLSAQSSQAEMRGDWRLHESHLQGL